MAARQGPWKAHFATQGSYGIGGKLEKHDPPLLFHLEHDLGETHNLAAAHPEVISQIRAAVAEHEKTLQIPPSQLDR
jgi:hypothetical protein